MISNQILQTTLDGLKGISRVELGVFDSEGRLIYATATELSNRREDAVSFGASVAQSQEIGGYQFFKIFDEEALEFILVTGGSGEDVYLVGRMAAFQLTNLVIAYKEKLDKDSFIKNLLLDNLLLVDIYNRAKNLHIDTDARRSVMLLETSEEKDFKALEKVKTLFDKGSPDFVTAVDEKNVIIVKTLGPKEGAEKIEETAKNVLALFEGDDAAVISYGTIIGEIKEVSRSFKEARMAMDVGRIFFEDRRIIAYSSLGIGRLIYQLPIPLCKMFIKEIFDGKSPDDFDEETIITINKFFENSLNVSETSRQLYIHRNTLVYRLDKLQKMTGLDLRVFEDAITFRIALMVVKYMKYMETMEY